MPVDVQPFDNNVISNLLGALVSSQDIRARVLLNAPPESRFVQSVYFLSLQNVLAGTRSDAVVGTRYLAVNHGLAVAADVIEEDGRARIASVSSGYRVQQAVDAIPVINRLPDVQRARYELRALSVPGVQTEAYWLKFINGDGDRFVPYVTLNKNLKMGNTYDWGDFLRAIQEKASMNLQFFQATSSQVNSGRSAQVRPDASRP